MKRKTIIIVSVILIVVVSIALSISNKGKKVANSIPNETTVERRDITSTIKGSATILPKDQYSITTLVSGDVVYAGFEEGDVVSKDQLLYKIDSSDIEKNISSADVALRQSRLNYEDALKNRENLYVTSDCSGVIKQMFVKLGDMVAAGAKIAEIYNDRVLELKIPFNESDIKNIYIGAQAVVKISNSSEFLTGTVIGINNASYVKMGNMLVQDVIISVNNPGTLSISHTATATIGDIACNDSGEFKYSVEKTVLAKTTGEVIEINIQEGNYVNEGEVLVTLKNDSLETSISNHSLSVESAEIAKSKAIDALDNFIITAPISGTVVTKNVKAGDKIDTSTITQTQTMAVIYDMSSLKLNLNVDELDINRVYIGQEVKITADALFGAEYTGYISNISIDADVKNGITTYPVTVEITEFDDKLIPGMNVDVEIVAQRVENVLAVPVNVVQRDNIVYVKGEKTDPDDEAPEGFRSVTVETGVYSTDYIEIVSGLSEGDVVYYQLSQSSFVEEMQKAMGGPGAPH